MNIANLLEKIDLFNQLVVESGFTRDVTEFTSATATTETSVNLASLRQIAGELLTSLEKIEDTDLRVELINLMPWRDSFLQTDHTTPLRELINDPEVETADFHSRLTRILSKLGSDISSDQSEISALANTFNRYRKEGEDSQADEGRAVMAVVLRDRESIGNLKSFARSVEKWNKTLFMYHQLVSGEPPKEFRILEVQDGSIDIIFDIKADVAIRSCQDLRHCT